MENIWAYDFDGTIYDGDSSIDFFFFCLKKKISLVKYLPLIIYYTFLYVIKIISTKKYKEKFFAFLKSIPNVDEMVEQFWQNKQKKIKNFFLDDLNKNNRAKICIISASPKFLISGYTKNLKNVILIATEMDKKTGIINGNNCKGNEKVIEFKKKFKKAKIEKFYGDSKSDELIAKLAKKSYLVIKENIYEWNDEILLKEKSKKISLWLFMFFLTFYLIIGIYLSFLNEFNLSPFFGADTGRVIGDMTSIYYNHYRVRVHPLYVLILQPITLILGGITINKLLAALIINSIISSISIVLIYKIGCMFTKNEKIKLLISCMYGFSFSKLIFTASIESFNFASISLILIWYFVAKVFKEKELPKNFYLILILLGIFAFGITITNIIVFFIALFILWIGKKIKLKKVIGVVIATISLTLVLSTVQNYVWHNAPTLYQSFFFNFDNEKTYIDYKISLPKIEKVTNELGIQSIFANDLVVRKNIIYVNNPNSFNIAISIAFYLIVLLKLIKNFKYNKLLNLGILLTMLFNFILHLFYGTNEAFIYSLHFSYLPFLLLCINCREEKLNLSFYILLIVGFLETICNFKIFKDFLVLANKLLKHTYYRNFHNPILLIAIVSIIIIIYLLCYLIYKNLKKLIKGSNNKLVNICGCIICLIFINLIFISIDTMANFDKILDIPLHIKK